MGREMGPWTVQRDDREATTKKPPQESHHEGATKEKEVVMSAYDQCPPRPDGPGLASGVRVQVWGTCTGTWVPGYQIVAASPLGYVVRRASDRFVLRRLFSETDLRVDPIPMPPFKWAPGSAA